MFLATGILAGPSCFGIIRSYEQIELLAHIGIALLLFIVGLKLDLHLIRTTGPVALATGLGQIVFTSAIAFFIALGLGMSKIIAAYVAVALTFSSTIIIVKLLSDKKEIDSLHGQIAIGFLIVQDIAAILALVGLTTFGSSASGEEWIYGQALVIASKGLGLLVIMALLMRYILPHLIRHLAHSQELLALFAITWAVLVSAGSDLLGFTKEVGAFLAGVSLASSVYRDTIGARLTNLRDFLLLFFFVDLGARLDWVTVGSQIGASVLFSLFVLIGNPFIVLAIMGVMGYRRRTGFLAGLTVAQISEFSLILASLGLALGHINKETMGLITLVGVVTIFASTYLILYSDRFYRFLSSPLKLFERRNPYRETAIDSSKQAFSVDAVLMGLGNYGSGIAEALLKRNRTVFGVDFDPDTLRRWRSAGISVVYGDMADPEILEQLPLGRSRWVVSTIRSKALNLTLLQYLKARNYGGRLALTAVNQEEAGIFEKAGADVVFRPFMDAAEQAADDLIYAMDFLTKSVDWPIAFREFRVRPETVFAGKKVRNIPLRSEAGANILAVSRSGRVHYDPDPDFRIYPGDRVVIMGGPDELRQAESLIDQIETNESVNDIERFKVAEIRLGENSNLTEKKLSEIRFRQKYGVTVVGIRRGEDRLLVPKPEEQILAGDCIVVVGFADAVDRLKNEEPL
jgi:predicted Kef-type K+ transport protein/Trk K+ transport system NAD-binding subunit